MFNLTYQTSFKYLLQRVLPWEEGHSKYPHKFCMAAVHQSQKDSFLAVKMSSYAVFCILLARARGQHLDIFAS